MAEYYWVEQGQGAVLTEFETLVARVVDAPALRQAIDELVQAKRQGAELDYGPRIAPISAYIEAELNRLAHKQFEHEYGKPAGLVACAGENLVFVKIWRWESDFYEVAHIL